MTPKIAGADEDQLGTSLYQFAWEAGQKQKLADVVTKILD